ncbi:SDR family NAD(P)-dependent oxidoreductase [Paracoccus jeotgali]|uniref:Short-chain dehydrogenase n=1 Tax=Paracoccus jeotgali TaxID=2065379 RepID=A0A2K9MI35_9RHOB|nr:SDR family oxidoreductase [Paracoccus jeotgali]AUM75274.1 short-chain dehydrogenase [Paracoccus jeotgali]
MDYTAVITGGNKGIGADLAQAMLQRGWRVVSLARHKGEAEGVEHVICDLLDPDAVAGTAAELAARHQVTHFVHNAGIILPNLIEDATPQDMQVLTQLHLGAALTLTQAFLPAMKAQRFGRVLFNASRAALGARTRTAYSASKAGMIGMARTWALELAEHGITVNVVAPGPILTDNFWGIVPKDSPQQQDLAQRIPVGRLGTVADVTRAFMFLADPEAGFITGQTLFVCGGASIGTVPI